MLDATYLHAVWHCELALFHVQKPLVCEHCTAVMDVHSCWQVDATLFTWQLASAAQPVRSPLYLAAQPCWQPLLTQLQAVLLVHVAAVEPWHTAVHKDD